MGIGFTDSTLVLLYKWSSYRGGRLSSFDCHLTPTSTKVQQSLSIISSATGIMEKKLKVVSTSLKILYSDVT